MLQQLDGGRRVRNTWQTVQRRPLIRAATARRQSAQQGMLLATGLALLAVLSIVVLIVPR